MYDTVGRRKPLLFAMGLATIAIFIYPFVTNFYVYLVISALIVPLNSLATLPFIPDLIVEESQPLAIFINIIWGAIAKLVNTV